MKKGYRKYISAIAYGVDKLFLTSSISVVTYHSVSDNPGKNAISVESFKKQIEYLYKNDVKVLDLETFLAIRSGKQKPKGRSVLITFDDGYKDLYTNALPILQKYNMPSVLFLTPSCVGKKSLFASSSEDGNRDMLSLEEVQELSQNNIAIANHGWSHKVMSDLIEDEQRSEYMKAAEWIKKYVTENAYPNVFAFPKGGCSGVFMELLSSLGLEVSFAGGDVALTRNKLFNRYPLPRITVWPDWTVEHMQRTLSVSYMWLRKYRKIISIVSAVVLFKMLLGILLLLGMPDVGIGEHLFTVAGGDDVNYVKAAQQLIVGDFSIDSMIGYPIYLAVLMLFTGITSLPQIAFPHTLMSLFVIEPLSLIFIMLIAGHFWKETWRILFAGLMFISLPYLWWLIFGDFTLTTVTGAPGLLGLTRTQQLFGLPLLADGLGAMFFSSGLLLFLKALSSDNTRWYMFSGFLIGIAGVIRIQNLLLIIALAAVLTVLFRWKQTLWFVLSGLIALIPQFVVNTLITGVPYIFSNYSGAYNKSFDEATYGIQNFIDVPAKIYGYSPIALVLIIVVGFLVIWGTLHYFWRKKDFLYVMLFVGILSPAMLFYFESSIRNPRYFLPFIPLLLLLLYLRT